MRHSGVDLCEVDVVCDGELGGEPPVDIDLSTGSSTACLADGSNGTNCVCDGSHSDSVWDQVKTA